MGPDTEPSDATGYFGSEDEIVDYINSWMQDGSPHEIARAVGDVARANGLTEISPSSGIGPQALYPALSRDGNPTLETLIAVLSALGLRLTVQKAA